MQGAGSTAADVALQSRDGSATPPTSSVTASDRRGKKVPGRLVSLDAFRGFIMTMLAASGFGIAGFAAIEYPSDVWNSHDHDYWKDLAFHFNHPDWLSAFDYYKVSFWDLIQPAFMFMVGVAMPFSNARRAHQEQSFVRRAIHALVRSLALILLGVFLSSTGHSHTVWEFPNVLCQIGLGYFFAWILLNFRPLIQCLYLAIILVGYWMVFFFNPPPADYDFPAVNASIEKGEVFEGTFSAWSKNGNVAFFFDRWLLPQLRTVPEASEPPEHAARLPAAASKWQTVVFRQDSAKEPAQPETAPAQEPSPSEFEATDRTETSDAPGEASSNSAAPAVVGETANNIEIKSEKIAAGPGLLRRIFLKNEEPWTPNRGGYATLNFVPSIGTTILGILCGQLLMAGGYSHWSKLGILILAAGVCLGLGILADQTVCPIVKRIWTPSWVLFSGGYVIGMLALFYFLFDIAPLRLLAYPLVVVGMNSILIYMMGQTLGGWTRNNLIKVHLAGLIEAIFGPKALDPQWFAPITLPTTTFVIFWLFLYWLHRQRIYLRL